MDRDMTIKSRLDTWVNEHYKWISYQIRTNIAKGQMAEYADDLIQEMMIQLYGMKEEKIEQLLDNGKLKWYVLTGAGMQLRSKTSPFYSRLRKHKMMAREHGLQGSDQNIFERIDDTEELDTESYFICMKKEIENLHWYNKQLLKDYWEKGMGLDALNEKYSISKTHLTKDLNAAILQIRERCKYCND